MRKVEGEYLDSEEGRGKILSGSEERQTVRKVEGEYLVLMQAVRGLHVCRSVI